MLSSHFKSSSIIATIIRIVHGHTHHFQKVKWSETKKEHHNLLLLSIVDCLGLHTAILHEYCINPKKCYIYLKDLEGVCCQLLIALTGLGFSAKLLPVWNSRLQLSNGSHWWSHHILVLLSIKVLDLNFHSNCN